MKLEDYRKKYYEASAKASEIVRQLGLAGIAVIWVFKTEQNGALTLDSSLRKASACILIGLALDLIHYIYRTLAWGIFTWVKRKVDRDKDIKAPRQINWPSIFFFAAKIVSMVVAYIFLISYLTTRIT